MHKCVIMLVKTDSDIKALTKVRAFLEPYGGEDRVWDWYQIGGRWTGLFAPKRDEFFKWADEFLKSKQSHNDYVEHRLISEYHSSLQFEWEKMGMKGTHPYFDHYKLPESGGYYDVMSAKECEKVIREWTKDMKLAGEEFFKKCLECRAKGDTFMAPYYAGLYSSCSSDEFSSESNVFDIDEVTNNVPESLDGYMAVVVDMHH